MAEAASFGRPSLAGRAIDMTFVIPAWRAGATIADAIDSALAQDGLEVEVVVVDDASPEGPPPAAIDHPSGRVRLVRRERNGGPGAARNDGFAVAQGRWIAVLDADDTVRPERGRRMIEAAEATGSRVVVDNLLVNDSPVNDGSVNGARVRPMFAPAAWARRGPLGLAEFVRSNTLFDRRFNHGYLKPVFARSLVEEAGLRYDPALRIGEDFLFLAEALAHGPAAIAPLAGYGYGVREGSISRVLRLDHVRAMQSGDRRLQARLEASAPHAAESADAVAAFARRARSLDRAAVFLRIVQAIKERRWNEASRLAFRHPSAARLLAMPVGVRVKRWGGRTARAAARTLHPLAARLRPLAAR